MVVENLGYLGLLWNRETLESGLPSLDIAELPSAKIAFLGGNPVASRPFFCA
jgi:hypothetical protein